MTTVAMNANPARTFFAIKSSSRLQAPALFFNWEDASQYLHSSTLSSTEYGEFDNAHVALQYIMTNNAHHGHHHHHHHRNEKIATIACPSSASKSFLPSEQQQQQQQEQQSQPQHYQQQKQQDKVNFSHERISRHDPNCNKRSIHRRDTDRRSKRHKRSRPKDDLCDTTRALRALNFERSSSSSRSNSPRPLQEGYFWYTGQIHDDIPKHVTHIKIGELRNHTIPESAFRDLKYLSTVHFSTPIRVVERRSFFSCQSLRNISLPPTIVVIGHHAFRSCFPSGSLTLPEGLERIGKWAFRQCGFRTVRVPPLVEEIDEGTFSNCTKLLSCEIPSNLSRLRNGAFGYCQRLRNIAIGPTTKVCQHGVFGGCQDLMDVFQTEEALVDALQHRFDDLPLHKLCYYHNCASTVVTATDKTTDRTTRTVCLEAAAMVETPRHDCLGMTPLHILALSSNQDSQIYHTILQSFPSDLLTRDRWGEIPLSYACHNDVVPPSILQWLLESTLQQQSEQQEGEVFLDWVRLMNILCLTGSSLEKFQVVLNAQRQHCPGVSYDWGRILQTIQHDNVDTIRYLLAASIHNRLEHLGLDEWRHQVQHEIDTIQDVVVHRQACREQIHHKLVQMERKESLSLVEHAVWKARIAMGMKDGSRMVAAAAAAAPPIGSCERNNPYWRELCRVKCGAEIVVSNILPFLDNYESLQNIG